MSIIQNLPEIKVSLHPVISVQERRIIRSSDDINELMRKIWNDDTIHLFEEFYSIYLDKKNGVIGYRLLNRGNQSSTTVNTPLLLQIALSTNSSSIILCHNHPSGQTKPSKADDKITQKINDATKLLDLKLLDHIIITPDSYFSYSDEGRIS